MLRRKKSVKNDPDFTRVYLWRHPEARGQSEGKFWGQRDVDLNREGKSQAQWIINYMVDKKVSAVYCSDLSRTRVVADSVARTSRKRPGVTPLKELRELSLGVWEGLTFEDIRVRYPQDLERRYNDLVGFKIEGGESLGELADRVIPAFQRILEENAEHHICIIGHGGVNRVILCRIMGAPLDNVFRIAQDHAHLNIIDVYQDGTPVIKAVNLDPPKPLTRAV
jgi:alpha-ribazole phosphatase